MDGGEVEQVQAVHVQPAGPVGEVGQRAEEPGGVLGEARGHDHVRAVAQQFQRHPEADLDAAAGDDRRAPGQIGPGVPPGPVLVGAAPAHQVVVAVHLPIIALAHVAEPLAAQRAERRRRGRGHRHGRRELGVEPGRRGHQLPVGRPGPRRPRALAPLLDPAGRRFHRPFEDQPVPRVQIRVAEPVQHGQAGGQLLLIHSGHSLSSPAASSTGRTRSRST